MLVVSAISLLGLENVTASDKPIQDIPSDVVRDEIGTRLEKEKDFLNFGATCKQLSECLTKGRTARLNLKAEDLLEPDNIEMLQRRYEALELKVVDIIREERKEVMEKIGELPNLTVLDLSGNLIGADGAKWLAENLKDTNVHTVDLSDNNIGADGVKLFAKNIQNTNVRTVVSKRGNLLLDDAKQKLQDRYPDIDWIFQ
jgi:Leucine-rich repeat (LRR) protein